MLYEKIKKIKKLEKKNSHLPCTRVHGILIFLQIHVPGYMVDEIFFFHFFDFSIEKIMMKICLGVIRFQIGGFFEKKMKK